MITRPFRYVRGSSLKLAQGQQRTEKGDCIQGLSEPCPKRPLGRALREDCLHDDLLPTLSPPGCLVCGRAQLERDDLLQEAPWLATFPPPHDAHFSQPSASLSPQLPPVDLPVSRSTRNGYHWSSVGDRASPFTSPLPMLS